jgi:hypothetical protein
VFLALAVVRSTTNTVSLRVVLLLVVFTVRFSSVRALCVSPSNLS